MSQEHVQQFIQEAHKSISGGYLEQGLTLLDQAIGLDPSCAEAHSMRGIVLSQLAKPQEAALSFEAALNLNPNQAKIHYNFAVHLWQNGEKALAELHARAALSINPDHAGAKAILSRLGIAASGADSLNVPYQPPSVAPQGIYRDGYDTSDVGSIEFVHRMGRSWTIIGVVLGSLQLVSASTALAISILRLRSSGTNALAFDQIWQQTSVSNLFSLMSLLLVFFSFLWMILDLLNRRGNWLWLFPYMLCCCLNSGGVIQLIYLWKGRK